MRACLPWALAGGLLALPVAPASTSVPASGTFAPPFLMAVNGEVLDLPADPAAAYPYHNSFPWLADMDGDRKPELLVGQGGRSQRDPTGRNGRLRIYRNVGEPGRPRFAAPVWFDASVPTGLIPAG